MQPYSIPVKSIPNRSLKPLQLSSLSGQDIGITSIQDGHGRASEELSASSTQFNLWRKKSKQVNIPSKVRRLYRWVAPRKDEASVVGSMNQRGMYRRTLFPAKWWTLVLDNME